MGTYFFASFYPGNEQKACLWQLASAFFIHFNFFPFFTTAPFSWDIATLKRQQHTRGKKNYPALKWVKKPKRLQGSTMEIWCEKSAIMRWCLGEEAAAELDSAKYNYDDSMTWPKKMGHCANHLELKWHKNCGSSTNVARVSSAWPCQDSMLWTKNGAFRHGNGKISPHVCIVC